MMVVMRVMIVMRVMRVMIVMKVMIVMIVNNDYTQYIYIHIRNILIIYIDTMLIIC